MASVPTSTTQAEAERRLADSPRTVAVQDNPPFASGANHALENKAPLACERCKRRKIKCDRALPSCRSCLKTSHSCSFPTSPQKPGPKPGVPQRRKVRCTGGHDANHPYPSPALRSDSRPSHDSEWSIGRNIEDSSSNHDLHGSFAASTPYSGSDTRFIEGVGIKSLSYSQPSCNASSAGTYISASRVAALAHILHLSHDPLPNDETDNANPIAGQRGGIDSVCADLQITSDVFSCLLDAYFDNMAAFSLFHRPSFAAKVSSITSHIQQRALLASMFAFSCRFMEPSQSHAAAKTIPSHDSFRKIAEESVDEALKECLDESPPLCLLQALILITFQQLTNGVRGRSWRALHTCVSIAYDLHLHLVDKSTSKKVPDDTLHYLLEEKRRAWWTLWEFDVFASTIRKLPTAINWTNNETWLPIEDELWFNNTPVRSCILDPDPAQAWKELEKSGNQSSKAWFIVINALMRCGHIVALPHIYPTHDRRDREWSTVADAICAVQDNLDVLANSLYCLSAALPNHLSYSGEFLNFSSGLALHHDSAKHAIHIMTNLCRFMLHHLSVFNSTYRQLGVASSSSSEQPQDASPIDMLSSVDKAAWNVYLAAASEVVNIIRNSSPKHVRFVNPFLASTIWLAAAAQTMSRKVGPHSVNRRVAESNFDVLRMNLDAYVSFWGVSSVLQQKLKVLNARLDTVGGQVQNPEPSRMLEIQSQSPMTSSGMTTAQQSMHYGGGYEIGATTSMQYPPLNQPALGPSANAGPGQLQNGWATLPSFNFGDGMVPDLSAGNTWSYGLDELLTYGGFE